MNRQKPKLAVHKFSSCDGCQLALLNLGEPLLQLPDLVEIVHFAEAGPCESDAEVDISLVEGSISTPEDVDRIRRVRENSRFLVAMGVCATAGGLQALANFNDRDAWMSAIYPQPQRIDTLTTSKGISDYVKVDLELQGCPVNSAQVLHALRDLLSGVKPSVEIQPVCMECKRNGVVCTLVSRGEPCMGPVTLAGCGALCPANGRGCYGCYGPAELVNDASLAHRFEALGLDRQAAIRRFRFIASNATAFKAAGDRLQGEPHGE
ncbi:MAG: sulfhydrogenase subunit delta [Candidatus Thiodiazotropha sp. (ex Dulcina madagascariensis)]|nr:sulfhydrogenase subunit delta [Candidatus Thiodiazotropha sp. (ex Dulcina madagascariensis)]MCU7926984.1 sulfhydrogenase subunit delta [Candidatus Thiodiazotropha sp. (ex Dulcina madagascariensis)]